MGVATPKSGQIAFSDLNSGILQAGTTAQLDMNTAGARLGYGSTSQLSISNLRGCLGFTTGFTLQPATKYTPAYYQSPQLSLTYSPNSDFVYYVQGPGVINTDNISFYAPGFADPSAGWKATNITIVASENTTRTIDNSLTSNSVVQFTPAIINSTAVRAFGVKFV